MHKLLFLCFFLHVFLSGHGFVGSTLVHLADGRLLPIESLVMPKVNKKCIFVESYDYNDPCFLSHRIVESGKSISPWCIRLGFDDNRNNDIISTPTQAFYHVKKGGGPSSFYYNAAPRHSSLSDGGWRIAHDLCVDDELVGYSNRLHKVVYKEVLPSSCNVYTIEVEKTHTFFVGKQALLTHNMALPTSLLCEAGISLGGLGAAIGSLCSSPITIVIAGIIAAGCVIAKAIKRKKVRNIKCR